MKKNKKIKLCDFGDGIKDDLPLMNLIALKIINFDLRIY